MDMVELLAYKFKGKNHIILDHHNTHSAWLTEWLEHFRMLIKLMKGCSVIFMGTIFLLGVTVDMESRQLL